MRSLSLAAARRIALAAQGFDRARPAARRDLRQVGRVLDRVGLVQLDSVNVLVRSHYLPLFSRLGPYADRAARPRRVTARRRTLFEYWGHEASLLPVALQPLLRWRMERAKRGEGTVAARRALAPRAPAVRRQGARRRSATAGRWRLATSARRGRGQRPWWGWSEAKRGARVAVLGRCDHDRARRRDFERVYDLTERVLPAAVLASRHRPPRTRSARCSRIAARALGVATERDLRDYFRLPARRGAPPRIAELVEAGRARAGDGRRLDGRAYLDADAKLARPRRGAGAAVALRLAGVGPRSGRSGCSGFAIASRSTRRRTSARTATTCCRSCSATVSSPASTSRPTGPPARCA